MLLINRRSRLASKTSITELNLRINSCCSFILSTYSLEKHKRYYFDQLNLILLAIIIVEIFLLQINKIVKRI